MKLSINRQTIVRYLLLTIGLACVIVASGDPVPAATFGQWLTVFTLLTCTSAACFYALHRIAIRHANADENISEV